MVTTKVFSTYSISIPSIFSVYIFRQVSKSPLHLLPISRGGRYLCNGSSLADSLYLLLVSCLAFFNAATRISKMEYSSLAPTESGSVFIVFSLSLLRMYRLYNSLYSKSRNWHEL